MNTDKAVFGMALATTLGIIVINVAIWGGLLWAIVHFAKKLW